MATTTPNYGWDVPTSTDYVKDGATAIETLGDDIDATLYTALGGTYQGLRLLKKQTIGSAVSSVSVTDAFNATYANYKIIVSGGTASAENVIKMTLGASITGYSGAASRLSYSTGAATIANCYRLANRRICRLCMGQRNHPHNKALGCPPYPQKTGSSYPTRSGV